MREAVKQFLLEFAKWASEQPDILGVALVGSHARNEAMDQSDIDLVVISVAPKNYLRRQDWARRFGSIYRQQIEDYGELTSLRVWYSRGYEVEYGFTDEKWSASPVDEGTLRVISSGFQIIWESVCSESSCAGSRRPPRQRLS